MGEKGDGNTLHILFSFVDDECIAAVCFLRILLILAPDDANLEAHFSKMWAEGKRMGFRPSR
jgi:hypothetical protein